MNGRVLAAEATTLMSVALCVYGGTALVVAASSDGVSVSIGAVVAVVGLSYGLARLLQRVEITEAAARIGGTGLSIVLLYFILRVDIAGEPYLWKMDWLVDLLSDWGRMLQDHVGEMTEVCLLGAVWLWGVVRGTGELTLERVLDEVGLGLLIVFAAAVLAPAAGAPGALRWLPVPYLAVGLMALALTHLRSGEVGHQPFLGAWMLWTGGPLGIMAGLATLAVFLDMPSLQAAGHAVTVAVEGLAALLVLITTPFLIALSWLMGHLIDWLVGGRGLAPETRSAGQPMIPPQSEPGEPAGWLRMLGYALRSGLVVLAIAVAVSVFWFAYRRLSHRRQASDELEEPTLIESRPPGTLRTLLSGAIGRLRGRTARGHRGRDAIGRLYWSMLHRAAGEGLPRPPAATPLEFALRLEEHFGSPTPGRISRAFAAARYGRRPPPQEDIERLRASWEVESRRDSRARKSIYRRP
jgi:Domain of unknown function (DUF4129)